MPVMSRISPIINVYFTSASVSSQMAITDFCSLMQKRKDYAFWHQFVEKPSIYY